MRRPLATALLSALLAVPALAATAPPQPKEGPGSANYQTLSVAKRAVGRASTASYVFHPEGPAAEPRPVVVFLHAWGATNPQVYGNWIEHLARKGNLVIWPRFQELNKTRPADATANAIALVRDALAQLANDPDARPDLSRVALVGHLAGAPLAYNLAAAAASEPGLPKPKLVFTLMAGGIASDAKSRGILLGDLSRIDPAALLVSLIGDREHLPSDRASKRLLRDASGVPLSRKVFMRALSDGHGFPSLSATLASPGAPSEAYDGAKIKIPPDPPLERNQPRPRGQKWSADMVLTGEQTVLVQQLGNNVTDALDYLAYWKSLDAALAAAFAGRDGQALRDVPAFTDMGRWSDGWPVKRLVAEAPRIDDPQQSAATAPAEDPRKPRPRR